MATAMALTLVFGINLNSQVMVGNNSYIGNRGGIPIAVAATQSNAGSSTTNAAYTLPNHTFRNIGVKGILVINFNAAVAASTGITITVNDASLPLTNNNDEALTALTAGLHIVLFDKANNKLQLIA